MLKQGQLRETPNPSIVREMQDRAPVAPATGAKQNQVIEYSVVIPVYDEEDSLPQLWEEMTAVMKRLQKPFEMIFVNDGSTDRSLELLETLKRDHPQIVNVIDLKQRHGQSFALERGLDAIRGSIVMTLDADLQNDPADIPAMIEKLEQGYDVVCGWRKKRHDRRLKTVLSKLGNILQRALTGLKIHDVSCTLRIYRKDCVKHIPLNREGQHRFIPLNLSLQGYRVGEIVANHRQRKFGKSKYGHKRIFKVIRDFFLAVMHRGKRY